MKRKLLYVAAVLWVALFVWQTYAHADPLPKRFIGEWCHSSGEMYSSHDNYLLKNKVESCEEPLVINTHLLTWLVPDSVICQIKSIVPKNGGVDVEASCKAIDVSAKTTGFDLYTYKGRRGLQIVWEKKEEGEPQKGRKKNKFCDPGVLEC
jgi:hypothetical protein